MVHYTLRLINSDSNLDLTTKKDSITATFQHIRDGGESGNSFKDLDACEIVKVERRLITIKVSESGNAWHRHVGKRLANRHGMRKYCDPGDSRRMFTWE